MAFVFSLERLDTLLGFQSQNLLEFLQAVLTLPFAQS